MLSLLLISIVVYNTLWSSYIFIYIFIFCKAIPLYHQYLIRQHLIFHFLYIFMIPERRQDVQCLGVRRRIASPAREPVLVTGKDGEADDIGVYRRCGRTPSGRKTSRSQPDRILRQALWEYITIRIYVYDTNNRGPWLTCMVLRCDRGKKITLLQTPPHCAMK